MCEDDVYNKEAESSESKRLGSWAEMEEEVIKVITKNQKESL